MTEQAFYGWYDDASQPSDKPSYEPPRDTPCLYCGMPIHADDVRTHSLMYTSNEYAKRSYFYRTHSTCDNENVSGFNMDGFILSMIERNED